MRTRQWWKDGQAFVWDGVGGSAEYGPRRSPELPTVSQKRVNAIADATERSNLPGAIRSKSKLGDYRTSPHVLIAPAGPLRLDDLQELSTFLIDVKLYTDVRRRTGRDKRDRHGPLSDDAARGGGTSAGDLGLPP